MIINIADTANTNITYFISKYSKTKTHALCVLDFPIYWKLYYHHHYNTLPPNDKIRND